jgi:hypothetical protein
MGERAWTMQEIEQLKATQADAPKGRRVPWSKLGYHEHEDFGLVAVDLWPHGLDDGSPVQGFLSHPERSGADLGALVTGADGSELHRVGIRPRVRVGRR